MADRPLDRTTVERAVSEWRSRLDKCERICGALSADVADRDDRIASLEAELADVRTKRDEARAGREREADLRAEVARERNASQVSEAALRREVERLREWASSVATWAEWLQDMPKQWCMPMTARDELCAELSGLRGQALALTESPAPGGEPPRAECDDPWALPPHFSWEVEDGGWIMRRHLSSGAWPTWPADADALIDRRNAEDPPDVPARPPGAEGTYQLNRDENEAVGAALRASVEPGEFLDDAEATTTNLRAQLAERTEERDEARREWCRQVAEVSSYHYYGSEVARVLWGDEEAERLFPGGNEGRTNIVAKADSDGRDEDPAGGGLETRKAPVDAGGVRVRVFDVVSRAVEEGVAAGWRRAHKHVDAPDPAHVRQEVERGVVNALCEVLDFPEQNPH